MRDQKNLTESLIGHKNGPDNDYNSINYQQQQRGNDDRTNNRNTIFNGFNN